MKICVLDTSDGFFMPFYATYITWCRNPRLENRLERLECRIDVIYYNISFFLGLTVKNLLNITQSIIYIVFRQHQKITFRSIPHTWHNSSYTL